MQDLRLGSSPGFTAVAVGFRVFEFRDTLIPFHQNKIPEGCNWDCLGYKFKGYRLIGFKVQV